VTLRVFTAGGREVAEITAISHGRGTESVVWGARDPTGRPVASGVYFYELSDGLDAVRGVLVVVR
jgi:hypothetical protein